MVSLLTAFKLANQNTWIISSKYWHSLTVLEENSMFCEPEATNVSRGEGRRKIDSQGSKKYTAAQGAQLIGALLFTKFHSGRKVPQFW